MPQHPDPSALDPLPGQVGDAAVNAPAQGSQHPLEEDTEAPGDLPLTQPELQATSLADYLGASARRIRSGESGVLPILAGLVVIVAIFQSQSPIFLSARNLVNLLVQGAVFMILGMGEVFVLLLGEIDLSIGYVAGIGGVVVAGALSPPYNLPWWEAVIVGLVITTAIGALQGTLVTRLGLPSFVVTLAGLLGWKGVMIYLVANTPAATGGTIRVSDPIIMDIVNGNLSPAAGWALMAAAVALYAAITYLRDAKRRRSGLVAPPGALTAAKVVVVALAGAALVEVTNINRGNLIALRGMPWVIPIILATLATWTFLLGRTRFGRYIYAIGGNAEAARRAGISLVGNRTAAFALTGFCAGAAGVVYESRLGSISINIDGGTLVLYAVAAAVIGGTSLFGGRGKPLHAVLGGIVIATIYNGLGLLSMGAAAQNMVTALVLLAAVTVDAVARRGRLRAR